MVVGGGDSGSCCSYGGCWMMVFAFFFLLGVGLAVARGGCGCGFAWIEK